MAKLEHQRMIKDLMADAREEEAYYYYETE